MLTTQLLPAGPRGLKLGPQALDLLPGPSLQLLIGCAQSLQLEKQAQCGHQAVALAPGENTQLPQPKPTPPPSRPPRDHPEESMVAMVSRVDASQAVALFPAETCPLLCQGGWRSPLPPAPFPICDLGPLPPCSLFGFLQVAWSTSLGSMSSFRVNRAYTPSVCHVPANPAPLELRHTSRPPGGLG